MLFLLWICEFRKAHTAISQFRGIQNGTKGSEGEEPISIQVLLLLIQHGANGLNLLEAQHVVLVEPLLNPAAEAQAISRVHRIGQKQKTLIHRFLVSISLSCHLNSIILVVFELLFSWINRRSFSSIHVLLL